MAHATLCRCTFDCRESVTNKSLSSLFPADAVEAPSVPKVGSSGPRHSRRATDAHVDPVVREVSGMPIACATC